MRQLNLKQQKTDIQIQAIGNRFATILGTVNFNISLNRDNGRVMNIEALVMDCIVSNLPTLRILKNNWIHLSGLDLADPDYHSPGRIDMLLEACQLSQMLLPGVIGLDPFKRSPRPPEIMLRQSSANHIAINYSEG